MEAEEECCTVDRQLVGLATKPVYRSLSWANLDEVISDEHEHILTGACCIRGEVAELFDCFPDGLNVRHLLRVGCSTWSQESRQVTSLTRWTAQEREE